MESVEKWDKRFGNWEDKTLETNASAGEAANVVRSVAKVFVYPESTVRLVAKIGRKGYCELNWLDRVVTETTKDLMDCEALNSVVIAEDIGGESEENGDSNDCKYEVTCPA